MKYLSEFQATDASALIECFTNEEVRRFLGGPVDAATAQEKVSRIFSKASALPVWVIVRPDKTLRCVVGYVFLNPHRDGKEIEISYALLPQYQRKGIALAAISEALAYGFDTLSISRIVAETQSQNARSIALLVRLGMTRVQQIERFGALQNIYALNRANAKSDGVGVTISE